MNNPANIWNKLQEEYKKRMTITKSISPACREIKDILQKESGKCLDVGCGVVIPPAYMSDNLEYYGIDPINLNEDKINCICGKAENLIYKDCFFDVVLIITALDHIAQPELAIKEAYRVLKKKGKFIYYGGVFKVSNYLDWKNKDKFAQIDKKHIWMFDNKSMMDLCKDFSFIRSKRIGKFDYIYLFEK